MNPDEINAHCQRLLRQKNLPPMQDIKSISVLMTVLCADFSEVTQWTEPGENTLTADQQALASELLQKIEIALQAATLHLHS